MNALSLRFLFLACSSLGLLSTPNGTFAATASYAAGRSFLTIDGVPAGFVKHWQGGEAIGEVVTGTSAGGISKKHLGATRYAPITVKIAFPASAPLSALIGEFLSEKSVGKTITLTDLNLNYVAVGAPLEAVNASLTEVSFQPFDAADKDSAFFTVVFSPELVRPGSPIATAAIQSAATAKNVPVSAFTFRVGTWPITQVNNVSAFSAKRRASPAGSGWLPLEFSNVTVTVNEAQSADWVKWADDFIVKGSNSDAQEKTAALEIRDALLTPVTSLQFYNVGIARLARVNLESGQEGVRRFQAELYFERLTFTTPLVAVPVAPASSTTTPATATAGPVLTPITAVNNTATPAGTTTATPAIAVGPVSTDTPPRIPASTNTSATANNPADLGAEDPRDFPRPAGLVRKTFTSFRRPASSEETATYSARNTIAEILSAYERVLKTEGWEQTMRNESGDPASGTHQFRLRWTKALEGVEIRLTQARAGNTEVSVAVTSTRNGALPGLKNPVPGTAALAVATAGTSGDLGARDPLDFPRPAGALRKSYTAAGTATAPQETVAYTVKASIAQLEAFYVGALSASDWEETLRREAGDPAAGSHQTVMNWSKARRTAAITLTETGAATTLIEAAVNTSGR